MAKNNSSSVFEIANRVDTNNATDRASKVANDLFSHKKISTINAHQISNIGGLQAALNDKQNVISGYTGNVSVVVGVDFTAETVTTVEIKIVNGIITEIN